MTTPIDTAALHALVAEARAALDAANVTSLADPALAIPALCDAVEALVREVGRLAEAREVDAQIDGRTLATLAAEAREARAEFTQARNEARDASAREHARIDERDRYRRLLAQALMLLVPHFANDHASRLLDVLARDAFPGVAWADIEKIAKGK